MGDFVAESSSSEGSPRYSIDESLVSETPLGLRLCEVQRGGPGHLACGAVGDSDLNDEREGVGVCAASSSVVPVKVGSLHHLNVEEVSETVFSSENTTFSKD